MRVLTKVGSIISNSLNDQKFMLKWHAKVYKGLIVSRGAVNDCSQSSSCKAGELCVGVRTRTTGATKLTVRMLWPSVLPTCLMLSSVSCSLFPPLSYRKMWNIHIIPAHIDVIVVGGNVSRFLYRLHVSLQFNCEENGKRWGGGVSVSESVFIVVNIVLVHSIKVQDKVGIIAHRPPWHCSWTCWCHCCWKGWVGFSMWEEVRSWMELV